MCYLLAELAAPAADGARRHEDHLLVVAHEPRDGLDDAARAPLDSACIYFSLPNAPPVTEPILVLNGIAGAGAGDNGSTEASGVVNTVCFPSVVSSSYAPDGKHLASVGVVGREALLRDDLESAARAELARWS